MFLGKWLRTEQDKPRDTELGQQIQALAEAMTASTQELRRLTDTLKERTTHERRSPGTGTGQLA